MIPSLSPTPNPSTLTKKPKKIAKKRKESHLLWHDFWTRNALWAKPPSLSCWCQDVCERPGRPRHIPQSTPTPAMITTGFETGSHFSQSQHGQCYLTRWHMYNKGHNKRDKGHNKRDLNHLQYQPLSSRVIVTVCGQFRSFLSLVLCIPVKPC